MEKLTAGLGELSQEISQGISQGLANILPRRRRSRPQSEYTSSRSQSPHEDFDDPTLEHGVDFEVEEEQVMKGLELVYHDKLNEADEYFETLKVGHARFSLHHAEVSSYVAIMSLEPEDVEFAIALLKETTSLALEQARRWRTHSNLKKVATAAQETVGAMTNWALKSAATALSKVGPVGAQAFAKLMPMENPNISDDDDDDVELENFNKEAKSSKRGEVSFNHRARRMRLWALLIQGECQLMTSLLQVVAVGESWTDVVKMGYNIQRTWSIYQHCQKKLKQLQNEWIALGGTFLEMGELASNMNVDYNEDSDDEHDIMDRLGSRGASSSHLPKRLKSQIQNYDPILAAPIGEMVYEGVRAAIGNLENLDNDIKEDQELASLRVGIQFGIGAFNLMVSLIPTNYQKAIELIGVPGDRNYGLAILQKVSRLHHCRAPLAAIVLLQYYTIIMGLLPYSKENAIAAQNVLNMLPLAWKESSIFHMLHVRLARYEGQLQMSTSTLEKIYDTMEKTNDEGGLILKLKSLLLAEFGWALFLQGDFVKASEKFGLLYKKTQAFKPLFAFLHSACYWEADEKYYHDAAKMLLDIPGMIANKNSTPTSMEQFANRIADEFIKHGQVPLFPALETIAVYNGFHHMDKATLKRHMDRIGDALMTQSPKTTSEYIETTLEENPHNQLFIGVGTSSTTSTQVSKVDTTLKKGEVIIGHRTIAFQSKSKVPEPEEEGDDDTTPVLAEASLSRAHNASNKFEHRWTKESKILCRYLLALCQRSLGDIKQAEANFRYVVSQTNVDLGNVVPYACFEWGSLLLNNGSTSAEGLNLLEKSVNYPPHEFQTRLKFVVSERLRIFRTACENDLKSGATMGSALNLRRVSELLRTVSVKERS